MRRRACAAAARTARARSPASGDDRLGEELEAILGERRRDRARPMSSGFRSRGRSCWSVLVVRRCGRGRASLASYIARSALTMMLLGAVDAASSKQRDADARGDAPALAGLGCERVRRGRLRGGPAATDRSGVIGVSRGSSTANSSPPRRASTSVSRSLELQRLGDAARSARRRHCGPAVSLTYLKLSRSSRGPRPSCRSAARARCGWSSSRSKLRRLQQPGERVVVGEVLELALDSAGAR